MKSDEYKKELDYRNSNWERLKERNQVNEKTKKVIKFKLGEGERMKSSEGYQETDDRNSIWEWVKE